MKYIETDRFSEDLRRRSIRLPERQILIANLRDSEQEKDLSVPVNCSGFGRVRHFRYQPFPDWSPDPLPIYPAAKALGQSPGEILRAQVFQHAACNWRCWYCYVDFDRLSANPRHGAFLTANELVDLYVEQEDRPPMIDLSGGQPDITPEWTLWMLQALARRNINNVFVWSDDNLSTDYLWKYLTHTDLEFLTHHAGYARVGCFKGYDAPSFAFNTLADPELFDRQFSLFKRLLATGFDMYAYVTFTGPPNDHIRRTMEAFVDRLQGIHENLPLRTVPLKIAAFTPTKGRLHPGHDAAIQHQLEAHSAWRECIERRYPAALRDLPICDISLTAH